MQRCHVPLAGLSPSATLATPKQAGFAGQGPMSPTYGQGHTYRLTNGEHQHPNDGEEAQVDGQQQPDTGRKDGAQPGPAQATHPKRRDPTLLVVSGMGTVLPPLLGDTEDFQPWDRDLKPGLPWILCLWWDTTSGACQAGTRTQRTEVPFIFWGWTGTQPTREGTGGRGRTRVTFFFWQEPRGLREVWRVEVLQRWTLRATGLPGQQSCTQCKRQPD